MARTRNGKFLKNAKADQQNDSESFSSSSSSSSSSSKLSSWNNRRCEANNKENTSATTEERFTEQIYSIMRRAQSDIALHKKYIKELQSIYEKMKHEEFMTKFISTIKSAMQAEEKNNLSNTLLHFCSKYSTSYKTLETHPVLVSTFNWLLSTISTNSHIRYRICQFVNFMLTALGNEASLEDSICDNILHYMMEKLRDINPNVRLQAIYALQRLQVPSNPDDIVVKAYQFHLSSDPSSRVRQAVITTIGRNYNTIPYIIERLWDIDEKVRRHTYVHMSSYPVKSYKVSQRLTFLEQGLYDRSESIRKVVTTVLLPQWFESYGKNFITFISALKLDDNEADIDRFRKITRVVLKEMFSKKDCIELITNLPLIIANEPFQKCVPIKELTVEIALYWLTLVEHFIDKEEYDLIVPELSEFCEYILKYCEAIEENLIKWEKLEHQYILLTLMEILYTFDLGDEVGRKHLKNLLEVLLKKYDVGERIIEMVVRCTENLMEDQEERLQFFVDIINGILDVKSPNLDELSNERLIFDELLEKQQDEGLKIKYSALKVKMLELKEREVSLIENKEYSKAEKVLEELNQVKEEYNNFLKRITDQVTSAMLSLSQEPCSSTSPIAMPETIKRALVQLQSAKKLTNDVITKCLKISFFMITSKKVTGLLPSTHKLYQDFIRRYIESNSITIRDWALKCGTSCSMLYKQISKDIFTELYAQLFKTNAAKIWKTSIDCIFELIDRYGFSHFEIEEKTPKDRKHNRQLYNTLEFLEIEDETSSSGGHGGNGGVILMLSHFLDTCEDSSIMCAIVKGFCRLILHDHIKNDDILEKLIIKYFNPTTDAATNQILGVFFENLIKLKKQEYFLPCILPTLTAISSAPYDSPLQEIKSEHVLKFIIDSTRPELCSEGENYHNSLALSFIQEMKNNFGNKELLRLLSKELITLEISISKDMSLSNDLKEGCKEILKCDVDPSVAKHIQMFKDILDGKSRGSMRNSSSATNDKTAEVSEEENDLEGGEQGVNDESIQAQNNENNVNENDGDTIRKQKNNEDSITEVGIPSSSRTDNQAVQNDNPETNTADINAPSISNTRNNSNTRNVDGEKNKTQNESKNSTMPSLKTPTNATISNLRQLRRSLNIRRHRDSSDEGPIQPPKIRIQAKLQSSRISIVNENRNTSSENETSSNLRKSNSIHEQQDNQKQHTGGNKNSNQNIKDKEKFQNSIVVKRNNQIKQGLRVNTRSSTQTRKNIHNKESSRNTDISDTTNRQRNMIRHPFEIPSLTPSTSSNSKKYGAHILEINSKNNSPKISAVSTKSQNKSKSKCESQKIKKVLHSKKQTKEFESTVKQSEVRLLRKRKHDDDGDNNNQVLHVRTRSWTRKKIRKNF